MNQRFTILGRSFGYVLHCLVLRAHRTRESVEEVPFCSLKTAQKKQENLNRETKRSHVRDVFLTEVFYRKVEKNRIDFPKQIRIKRKYLSKLKDVSQVYKGIRRMPRRFETKKDAISCDKLRRAASKL